MNEVNEFKLRNKVKMKRHQTLNLIKFIRNEQHEDNTISETRK